MRGEEYHTSLISLNMTILQLQKSFLVLRVYSTAYGGLCRMPLSLNLEILITYRTVSNYDRAAGTKA